MEQFITQYGSTGRLRETYLSNSVGLVEPVLCVCVCVWGGGGYMTKCGYVGGVWGCMCVCGYVEKCVI